VSNVVAFPVPSSDGERILNARDALLKIQLAVVLALKVLDSEEVFGTSLVLDGVDDILAALVNLVV
jgi:hypothetical protein